MNTRVDGIITSGPRPRGTASTIVAVSAGGVTLLREGALPYEEILATAGLTGAERLERVDISKTTVVPAKAGTQKILCNRNVGRISHSLGSRPVSSTG